jgi:tRNA(Ile)-lysidine synthase
MPSERPRLTPAVADVRRAVRTALADADLAGGSLLLVALSGGPDSTALAGALAFEAPRAGFRSGAVVIDHGLQEGSAAIADRAAATASGLGLDPVIVRRAVVTATTSGPEAAARDARYSALAQARADTSASAILLGHTLDDQAETVLLGLARGSGAGSLRGMPAKTPIGTGDGAYLRPLLGIPRATTTAFCADAGLTVWSDPHNADPAFTRVRVRSRVLPVLERELGPGIAAALARTADSLREDDEALEHLAREWGEEIVGLTADGSLTLDVGGLSSNPPALRQRIVRLVVLSEYGVSLSRAHTLAITALVTGWHGQGALSVPGISVERRDGVLVFTPVAAPDPLPST